MRARMTVLVGVIAFGVGCRAARFQLEDDADPVATDIVKSLLWQRNVSDEMGWSEAVSYCEQLELQGHDDWRLPDDTDFYFSESHCNDDYQCSTSRLFEFTRDVFPDPEGNVDEATYEDYVMWSSTDMYGDAQRAVAFEFSSLVEAGGGSSGNFLKTEPNRARCVVAIVYEEPFVAYFPGDREY